MILVQANGIDEIEEISTELCTVTMLGYIDYFYLALKNVLLWNQYKPVKCMTFILLYSLYYFT